MLRTHVRSALAAPHPLEGRPRRRIEPVADPLRPFLRVPDLLQVAEERPRRKLLHLLTGRAANGCVRGDEDHVVTASVLGGEALEQAVRVLGVADVEWAIRLVCPGAVEDENTARAFHGDEARERVAELARVRVVPGMQEVEAV